MLAAIDRDHLACHLLGLRQIDHRFGNIGGIWPVRQQQSGPLLLETGFTVMLVGQSRARPDPVDPDARGKALRHGAGGGP